MEEKLLKLHYAANWHCKLLMEEKLWITCLFYLDLPCACGLVGNMEFLGRGGDLFKDSSAQSLTR